MRSRVPLQIERVVETLPAECAQVTFHFTVTLHVAVQQPLKVEILAADAANESTGMILSGINRENVCVTCVESRVCATCLP